MRARRNSAAPSFGSFGRYFVASKTTKSDLPSSPASHSVVTRGPMFIPIGETPILGAVWAGSKIARLRIVVHDITPLVAGICPEYRERQRDRARPKTERAVAEID